VLLDTHAWAWSLSDPEFLSEAARTAIASADFAYVSPVSVFEISQKVRLGKWRGMEPYAPHLVDLLHEQGSRTAPLTPEICLDAGRAEWAHRDPFDRLLAATSRRMGVPLVTRDPAFARMGVACLW
jgi:PIN domain nuclease of toxin-antitoxin system